MGQASSGIEAGQQMADFAETADEGVDPRLAQGLLGVRRAEALHPAGGGQLEAFEKEPPVLGNGTRDRISTGGTATR